MSELENKKKIEMKERIRRFIKNQRNFLATTSNIKERIETTSLDLTRMVVMIPEGDMPLFREIIAELEKESKGSDWIEWK